MRLLRLPTRRRLKTLGLNRLMLERLLGGLRDGDAIASMGYPDILYPPDELAQKLGDKFSGLRYREDSEAICRRHGIEFRQIPDAESLFELYGASLDVYDIAEERGCEIVLDLNYPFPANACEQYEWVLDVGTLEHCFNLPQAAINMAAMAKVGGRVCHENPFNWGNHGFYGLNPTWYHDFYEANGFDLEECLLLAKDGTGVEAPRTQRFQCTEKEVNVLAIAKRKEIADFEFPTQTKYQRRSWAKSSSAS